MFRRGEKPLGGLLVTFWLAFWHGSIQSLSSLVKQNGYGALYRLPPTHMVHDRLRCYASIRPPPCGVKRVDACISIKQQKIPARRNARSALNPPPPLGGRSVPNRNSRTDRLQSLSRFRTLCRASPKIPIGKLSGLKFTILFRF